MKLRRDVPLHAVKAHMYEVQICTGGYIFIPCKLMITMGGGRSEEVADDPFEASAESPRSGRRQLSLNIVLHSQCHL